MSKIKNAILTTFYLASKGADNTYKSFQSKKSSKICNVNLLLLVDKNE